MKKQPRIKEKYLFTVGDRTVLASAKFAGYWVSGMAKCHPEDTFNEDFGKALAAARCNKKIAERRYARAMKRYKEATAEYHKAHEQLSDMSEYLTTAYELLKDARKREQDVMNWTVVRECPHDCS